jgi:hypothetical protein
MKQHKAVFQKTFLLVLLFRAGFLFSGCTTARDPEQKPPASINMENTQKLLENPIPLVIPSRDGRIPVNILNAPISVEELKQVTQKSVEVFIAELNMIMRTFSHASLHDKEQRSGAALSSYNAWLTHLDPEYLRSISDRKFLDAQSQTNTLRNISFLQDTYDYFRHVVVPSRTDDRVDDIAFVAENQVKAYTYNEKLRRNLVLYNLRKIGDGLGDGWLIIPLDKVGAN